MGVCGNIGCYDSNIQSTFFVTALKCRSEIEMKFIACHMSASDKMAQYER
jgi:hypothetical protein